MIFDFALKDFTDEQRQRVRDMLKPIPKGDRQSVLDEFNTALSKNSWCDQQKSSLSQDKGLFFVSTTHQNNVTI
ncbi:MAG: hypothetical protein ABFS56_30685 [Pseudomonadota bacterium]